MCFIRTKESKLLIAKRDITVYKVGIYADVQMFTPYFMTDYCYRRKALADALWGLSQCDKEFETKFKQLLNETKQRLQKEFDEL